MAWCAQRCEHVRYFFRESRNRRDACQRHTRDPESPATSPSEEVERRQGPLADLRVGEQSASPQSQTPMCSSCHASTAGAPKSTIVARAGSARDKSRLWSWHTQVRVGCSGARMRAISEWGSQNGHLQSKQQVPAVAQPYRTHEDNPRWPQPATIRTMPMQQWRYHRHNECHVTSTAWVAHLVHPFCHALPVPHPARPRE